MLCDTERRIMREWGVLNARERGGIAKPSVFAVDPGRKIRYASVGTVASRVPAAEVLSILQAGREAAPIRRKTYLPLPGDWIRAFRNNFRKP
jgi:peroxiredoxin